MSHDSTWIETDADGVSWLIEDGHAEAHRCRVERVIETFRTRYADVAIVDTSAFGRALVLDGRLQSTEKDEADYHEALVAPAFALAEHSPRRVAILGGGEGATLREVLRFPSVERCVMVDLDGELVQRCRAWLPDWSAGAFDDPRTDLVIGDARAWLEGRDAAAPGFDLIVSDLPDAERGDALQNLYSLEFFRLARRHLAADGLFVTQAGEVDAVGRAIGTADIWRTVAAAFDDRAWAYAMFMDSFWSEWCWIIAGAGLSSPAAIAPDLIDTRLAERRAADHALATYDGETHRHLFGLRRRLRDALASAGRPIHDLPVVGR